MTSAERAPTLDALKPYPAYKDSGVEWIGDIPQGWDIIRLKFAASIVNARAEEKPEHLRYLGLEHIEGGTGRLTDAPEPLQVTSIVGLYEADDVLFGKLRPYLMKVHLAEAPGCSSTEIVAFRSHSETSPRFLKYWLLSHGLISTTDILTFGSKMPRVAPEQLANLPFVAVPVSEQNAIAAFLDHETARIDALVREQELLLDDLVEKRRSTITAAVTAGIRPQLTQRTDIPWMPLIPQHWKVIPLKHLLKSLDQGWSPECENRQAEPGEWGVLKLSAVTSGRFLPEEHKTLPADEDPDPRLTLQAGDVLVTRANTRSLVGATALVAADQTMLMMSDLIYRLRTIPDLYSPAFLTAVLQSAVGRAVIELNANGTSHSMVKIPQRVLLNMPVPVPPRQEQDEIIEHIDHVLAQINDLVAEVRANIEDMKLLRSTLITAATTGKIDVRGWSPA